MRRASTSGRSRQNVHQPDFRPHKLKVGTVGFSGHYEIPPDRSMIDTEDEACFVSSPPEKIG